MVSKTLIFLTWFFAAVPVAFSANAIYTPGHNDPLAQLSRCEQAVALKAASRAGMAPIARGCGL